MKKTSFFKRTLLLSMMALGLSMNMNAGVTTLRWSATTTNQVWSDGDFSYCGAVPQRELQISFVCAALNCGNSVCPIKRYEFIVTLYKNGTQVHQLTTNAQDGAVTVYLHNYTIGSGVYTAGVTSRIKDFGCITYHTLESNVMSNDIAVTAINGTPSFNINGIVPQPNFTPITACASSIKINASATTCEDNYFIGVAECDQWLSTTGSYEWSKWFAGIAPDNINLQQLSAIHGGAPLVGGNLPSGTGRYYRVSVCVGPVWTCQVALLKVNGNCKTGPGEEDTNVYQVVDGHGSQAQLQPTTWSALLQTKADMTVFPNPSTGLFGVHMPSSGKATLEVYDMKGSKVTAAEFEGESYQLDLSRGPKGIYLVTVSDGTEHYTKRIVLE